MDYPKLFLTLSSVFTGWLLAQFSGIVKDWLHRNKVSQCLLEELCELQSELERTLLIYSRQLQIHALQGIDNGAPMQLSNHIFKNYYKDAVLGLNKHQRISIQLIHTWIETVNSGIVEHHELTKSILKKLMQEGAENITPKDGELWGNQVICEFTNVATALWHIKFHLSNPKSPDLSPFTADHERYLQYLESVEKKISEILEAAQNLDREKFDKIYNPEDFTRQFL